MADSENRAGTQNLDTKIQKDLGVYVASILNELNSIFGDDKESLYKYLLIASEDPDYKNSLNIIHQQIQKNSPETYEQEKDILDTINDNVYALGSLANGDLDYVNQIGLAGRDDLNDYEMGIISTSTKLMLFQVVDVNLDNSRSN
ncbi:MAG: hypothetical protein SFT91_03410 [Rickettsiaceae bacterium]|nr:hypothetical protein [Rickettsiaceae bacterium]